MVTSFPEHPSPQGLEVPEFPASYVNRLRAEVVRLRADLADAQRERDQARAEVHNILLRLNAAVGIAEGVRMARGLSAGGGDPAEGALIAYRVRLTQADDEEAEWGLFAPEDVQIVRVGPPAAASPGRAADTERRQG